MKKLFLIMLMFAFIANVTQVNAQKKMSNRKLTIEIKTLNARRLAHEARIDSLENMMRQLMYLNNKKIDSTMIARLEKRIDSLEKKLVSLEAKENKKFDKTPAEKKIVLPETKKGAVKKGAVKKSK
ncbi:MAG: hypothetical protein WC872_04170 [Candidatus Absconditabacterales bacterium]|jgi:hypothetical protein